MALNNSIMKASNNNTIQKQSISYVCGGEEITLSPAIVKSYLVSGDASNVTTQEIMMFMSLCKYQKLNPWVKEAYCIKYGNQPATLVVSKEAFQKRAEANPNYDGMDSGIVVITANGEIDYRKATLKLQNESIVGGWAEVYRKDRTHSTRVEVSFDEYAGRKKDGTLNNQWATKPATMIRKVAIAQALRETFPANLGGLFTAEEQGTDDIPPAINIQQESEPQEVVMEQPMSEIPTQAEPQAQPEQATIEAMFYGNNQ